MSRITTREQRQQLGILTETMSYAEAAALFGVSEYVAYMAAKRMLLHNDMIDDERPLPDRPTDAAPGSEAKIRVMQERVELQQALHHPADNWILPDEVVERRARHAEYLRVRAWKLRQRQTGQRKTG